MVGQGFGFMDLPPSDLPSTGNAAEAPKVPCEYQGWGMAEPCGQPAGYEVGDLGDDNMPVCEAHRNVLARHGFPVRVLGVTEECPDGEHDLG